MVDENQTPQKSQLKIDSKVDSKIESEIESKIASKIEAAVEPEIERTIETAIENKPLEDKFIKEAEMNEPFSETPIANSATFELSTENLVDLTVKRGRLLFYMIFMMGSTFSFWGVHFFVLNEPAQGVHISTYLVFAVMAILSFLYGFRFVKNYSKVRRAELKKQIVTKRKEAMVVATAIQLLLVEFVCIIGIFLAIFTQQKWVIFPFYALFLGGLYFSFPKADWYKEILEM